MGDGYNVNADILKVGHHGSRTASGASFIRAVSPAVSVIEVVAGNDYGHPHQRHWTDCRKFQSIRTDIDGTITITTDGSAYSISTQKTEPVQGAKSTSSGSVAYSSASSTTTPKTEPTEAYFEFYGSTVYVSDLSLKDEWVKSQTKAFHPFLWVAGNRG